MHLLDQVTPLPPTPQSRSTQYTRNNQLTPLPPTPRSRSRQDTHNNQQKYSHPLTLDMISSMHYHLISSHLIHPHPRPSHPVATNPPVQIHTTHTQQSSNILTPLDVGYDIIHALLSHLIHPCTSSTKSPRCHQPSSPDPRNADTTIN